MSFNNILELLHNSNENDKKIDDFTKFRPEVVEKISSNVADLIYKSFNDKSAVSTQKRLDIIEFLRTICCESAGHFRSDENNCQAVLNTFFKEPLEDDPQFQLFLNDLHKEYALNKPPATTEQIINYYKTKAQRDVKLLNKREGFKQKLEQQMPKDFKFTFSNSMKINNDFERIQNILGRTKDVNTNLESNKHRRKDKISLSYSLININENKQFDNIVKQILNELCQYKELYEFEMEYLTDLFRNTDILNMEFINKFPFIYEIPMIKLCATTLINCDINLKMQKEPYGKIFNIVETNAIFKATIIDICSTLFVLSNFNSRILLLLNKMY